MPQKSSFTKERIEKAARVYSTSVYAAEALGIKRWSFKRLCLRLGVSTPEERKPSNALQA